MSYTDTTTSRLVINKLSKQQYENIQNPSDTEIYLVPEDEEHKPICYPTTADNVGTTTMDLKSSVSDNGLKLTEVGFVYNTSGNPTVSDTKAICDLGVGRIEKSLSGLTQNTTYYIKSYGINQGGTSYGDLLTQATNNSPIPAEYQLVEYLQRPINVSAYIRTEIFANEIIQVTNIVALSDTSGDWNTFGASTANAFTQGNNLCDEVYNGYLRFTAAGGSSIVYNGILSNAFYKIAYSTGIVSLYTENGPILAQQYLAESKPHVHISFFVRNINGSPDFNSTVLSKSVKYKNIHIVTNDNEYNLYPVYRISDSKPGMYDIVNNVFYTNQGTGEFIVGPDKEWDE